MTLNHWEAGSHKSLLKHLQILVTIMFLESMSRQTIVPLLIFDERCILEAELASHFEEMSVHMTPTFTGICNPSARKQ